VFSNIIPKKFRESLNKVFWVDAGRDAVFGVARDYRNPKNLILSLTQRNYGYKSEYKSYYIHEYAHMLTLNEDQVKINEWVWRSSDYTAWAREESKCTTYFIWGWGCTDKDSYLFNYYHTFWKDIYYEHSMIETEEDLFQFFEKYNSRFFNAYSTTSPEEDI